MNLITMNDEKFISMVNTTSDLGDLGEATLVVDNKVQPKTLPCQKLAQTINDRVKPELYKLVDRGIRVDEIGQSDGRVNKANGKQRIYIDPQAF